MDNKSLCEYYIAEIKEESISTRKCLERIPENTYQFKPHDKSMEMGYLTLLVAEIPNWIKLMIEESVIDLEVYNSFKLSDTAALMKHYEDCLKGAINALTHISEESINTPFELKHSGKTMWKAPKLEAIGSTINHWVHHRGQLTVYMRLNDILVPSVYGPSADDKGF